MIKTYLGPKLVSHRPVKNIGWLYARWEIRPDIRKWFVHTNCNYVMRCEQDFTWQLYHSWINDIIDAAMTKEQYRESNYFLIPINLCKPYLLFDSIDDAVLFKLTW